MNDKSLLAASAEDRVARDHVASVVFCAPVVTRHHFDDWQEESSSAGAGVGVGPCPPVARGFTAAGSGCRWVRGVSGRHHWVLSKCQLKRLITSFLSKRPLLDGGWRSFLGYGQGSAVVPKAVWLAVVAEVLWVDLVRRLDPPHQGSDVPHIAVAGQVTVSRNRAPATRATGAVRAHVGTPDSTCPDRAPVGFFTAHKANPPGPSMRPRRTPGGTGVNGRLVVRVGGLPPGWRT